MLRLSLVGGNILLFAGVLYLVLAPSHSSANAPQVAATASAAVSSQELSALDQLASASIAQTAAEMTGVEERIPITNQADSERLNLAQASLEDSSLAYKPQVIESAYKSNKDIKTYVTKAGDTVSKIAAQFVITSDNIQWYNNLSSDSVNAGKRLLIPPVNGIVYRVKGGDTPATLALRYGVPNAKIIAYNDAELHGLKVGELIILPGATQISQFSRSSSSSYSADASSYYQYRPVYGYNGYDYGYCTWYVATKISIPANWGNAYSWDSGARSTPGFRVDSTPTPGSILQDDGSLYGTYHVAYVESVTATTVTVSEMNVRAHGGGWGVRDTWTWSRDQIRGHSVEFIHKL